MRWNLVFGAGVFVWSTLLQAQPTEKATELFVSKCSSCHSVGAGDRVGPDLKGVTDRRSPAFLTTMIGSPNSLLDSDPDARALLAKFKNVRMPDLGLNPDLIPGLVDLLKYCSNNTCDLAPKFTPVNKATASDLTRGRELFVGTNQLKNGGPACISCHTATGISAPIAGGTLARDLTSSFARLGDQGLDAALRNPAFPLMNKIFAAHPIEADEALALRAFLDAANRTVTNPHDQPALLNVPLAGTFIAAASLVIMNTFWIRRLRGVRTRLVGQAKLNHRNSKGEQ